MLPHQFCEYCLYIFKLFMDSTKCDNKAKETIEETEYPTTCLSRYLSKKPKDE